MKVVRNTYPKYPNIAHAEPGDIVDWNAWGSKRLLVRKSDGKTVFSRDCLPKHVDDTRPVIGVIAAVQSRGWFLELAEALGADESK